MTDDTLRFIDLFCGIGGFRLAAQAIAQEHGWTPRCMFSSDIDADAQTAYEANFGERPTGDITQVVAEDIPDHDLLLGGFPCQAFSICGNGLGFEDSRGTLFFDIARILKAKRPAAFILENVKRLQGHDEGRTLAVIMKTLDELGYYADWRVLNALDFGVPQRRERIFIVGFRKPLRMNWPTGSVPMTPLSEILEPEVSAFYYASEKIRLSRLERRESKQQHDEPTIWHENKAGNIIAYPYSCAMRSGASHNYLLVNGERRMTEREMLRLQGFPESYKIVCGYSATRKQTGNSVAVPCVTAVVRAVVKALVRGECITTIPPQRVAPSKLNLSDLEATQPETKGAYEYVNA